MIRKSRILYWLIAVAFTLPVVVAQVRREKGNAESAAQRSRPLARIDPNQLVRKAVEGEIKSAHDNIAMMFHVRRESPKGVQTRQYVETKDGTAGMLIAVNDKPLNLEQRQQEFSRLENLLNNPSELRRKQKQQKEDTNRVVKM